MPYPTFFNLPEEKRTRILAAIKDELARAPLEDVSINRIVQQAEIPRGSFYQYFEDKKDMLAYVLADYQNVMIQATLDRLKANQGDIFQTFLDLLDFTVEFVTQGQTNAFLNNLLSDIRVNIAFYSSFATHDKGEALMDELSHHVNMELLDIRDEDDFIHMMGILLPLTGEMIAHAFFDLSQYDELREAYSKKLALLKRGFEKNKGNP